MFRAVLHPSFRVILLLGLLAGASAGELGRPMVQNHPVREMNNRGYQPGPAVQDRDGAVYFGDWSQVAIYDGSAWATVDVPFGRLVRGPALGPDGKFYVGGNNLLGYLRDAPYGRKEFVSLMDQVPETGRDFRNIAVVAAVPGGVAFVAPAKLLLWRHGAFTVLDHGGARACADGDTLYLHAPGGPLRRLEGDKFAVVTDDPRLAQTQVVWVQRDAANALLIGTTDRGLFRLQDGRLTPLPTDIDGLFAQAKLDCALRLADGSLALALQGRGLFLLGADGRLLTTLDESNGLIPRGNTVRGLFADREGGLWISHAGGISRLEWPNAITVFDEINGLGNLPLRAVLRLDGVLYTTGAGGVYRLAGGTSTTPARFAFVPGSTDVRNLVGDPGGPLGATPGGLVQLGADGFVPVLKFDQPAGGPAYSLTRGRRDPARLWLGLPNGLRSVRYTAGRWIDEGMVPGVNQPVTIVTELADGTFWLTKAVDGFMRMRLTPGGTDPRGQAAVTDYGGGKGLPAKLAANNQVLLWREQPLFVTDYSVFVRDEAADRFVPFTAFGDRLNRQPTVLANFSLTEDGGAWVSAAGIPGPDERRARQTYRVTPAREWQRMRHFVVDVTSVAAYWSTWEEKNAAGRVLWYGGSHGLTRIEVDRAFVPLAPLVTRVRAEAIHDGQTWSDQAPLRDATDPRNPPAPAAPAEPALDVTRDAEIPHRFNSFKFSYATVSHLQGADLRYQTWLEGFESDWSPWTAERSRLFTNLPAGRYAFHVRGNTSEGTVSEIATLAFVVTPPWWATLWAYAAYGALAGALVAGIVRFRSRQLRRANEQLESLVAARTEELRTNEQQLRVARDGAEAANRAKTAFLANMSHELRTPLNAVLGYAQIVLRDDSLPVDPAPARRRHCPGRRPSPPDDQRGARPVEDRGPTRSNSCRARARCRACWPPCRKCSSCARASATSPSATGSSRPCPKPSLADEGRLRQVLINLLENAVKFTESGGRIDFEVGRAGDRIAFTVRDTGSGIAPDQVKAIFQPFHQAAAPHLQQQGAGLGLAISQRLAGLMGGAIQVESTPGQGSCFHFRSHPARNHPAPVGQSLRPAPHRLPRPAPPRAGGSTTRRRTAWCCARCSSRSVSR
ncbi:MAG: ATP-binding protein [Lacunisphaera sp.]